MNSATNIASTAPLISTADPSPKPYEVVRFNALKHGILSRYTVLSHENHADYENLVNSMMDEHLPAGATEQHLIEELASVIWRKRRVVQAEGATINRDLKAVASNTKAVVQAAAPFLRGVYSPTIDFGDVMDRLPDDVSEYQHAAAQDWSRSEKPRSCCVKAPTVLTPRPFRLCCRIQRRCGAKRSQHKNMRPMQTDCVCILQRYLTR